MAKKKPLPRVVKSAAMTAKKTAKRVAKKTKKKVTKASEKFAKTVTEAGKEVSKEVLDLVDETTELAKDLIKDTLEHTLLVKLVSPKAVMPTRMTDGAAGFDLVGVELSVGFDKHTGEYTYTYDTGVAMAIPKGHVGLLFPRSSVVKRGLKLANSVGVIDSDYRGTIKAVFTGTKTSNRYNPGDRIVQLLIVESPNLEMVKVDELDETLRGLGGFGSTDAK